MITTRGIVLNTVRYSDSSVITKVYTESAGLKSFMVRTGKGKSALSKMSLLQSLGLIEVSFSNDQRKGLQSPRVLERERVLNGIPFDTRKTCIALFMAEVITRAISEEESNPKLFRFLHQAILLLDAEMQSVINFHLKFMAEFSRHLGFYPHHRSVGQQVFDLSEGEFTSNEPLHPYVINGSEVDLFELLIEMPFEEHYALKMGNEHRRNLLQNLIDYYRLHLDGMKEITSHKILEEVFA